MSSIRPAWLRPSVAALVIAAHAALLTYGWSEMVRPGSGLVEIAVVSEPEPSPEPTPEILPTEASQAQTMAEPEPRENSVDETPAVPELPAPPQPLSTELPMRPKPDVVRESVKQKPPHREKARKPKQTISAVDASARAAARAEAGEARQAAAASYASLVAGEIRRHRHYPAAARDANITGVVVVAFTIGSSGRVSSHSIVRSSGHSVLDGAVRDMMVAVQLPPPPGGVFRSSIPVRFETH